MKRALIIAGPNGAGKSTFARQFLPKEGGVIRFVNADLIASGLSPFRPELANIAAGRIMLSLIDQYVASGNDFAFETTLSGLAYAARIRKWRAVGYQVDLIFLSLSVVEIALQRVRSRVEKGGHGVPPEVVRRRFSSGIRNLDQVCCHLVNTWKIYDNSGDGPRLLKSGCNP